MNHKLKKKEKLINNLNSITKKIETPSSYLYFAIFKIILYLVFSNQSLSKYLQN